MLSIYVFVTPTSRTVALNPLLVSFETLVVHLLFKTKLPFTVFAFSFANDRHFYFLFIKKNSLTQNPPKNTLEIFLPPKPILAYFKSFEWRKRDSRK